jgi:hypothetical protein
MGFLDFLEAAAAVGAELFRDRVSDITAWIDAWRPVPIAARVYLARTKEENGYVVGAWAVDAQENVLGEKTWHVRANTGMKAFMEGSRDEGLGELFNGKKEIYYDLPHWEPDEYDENDIDDDDDDEDEDDDFDDGEAERERQAQERKRREEEERERKKREEEAERKRLEEEAMWKRIDGEIAKDAPQTRIKFCPACGKELIAGAKFCAECGTPIPAAQSAAQADAERYYISKNFRQSGPFGRNKLTAMLNGGLVSRDFYACREGSSEWKPIGEAIQAQTAPGSI